MLGGDGCITRLPFTKKRLLMAGVSKDAILGLLHCCRGMLGIGML